MAIKNNQNTIPKELRKGRKVYIKRIIKSSKILHRFLYKLLRCNQHVWILSNFWKNTDKLFNCISIETCAICNRRCLYCPISKDPRPQVMMSDDLFDKIISELEELNYRGDIILSNFGEPLLDKRLATFVRRIKEELGSKVTFFTNGDFLTKERFDELISAGTDNIEISQHDPELSDILKLFSQLSSCDWKYVSFKIVKEDTQTLTDYGGLVDVETLRPFSCNPYRIIIRADGSVPLCCGDYFNEVNFGNVNQSKLIDIWNSPVYRKIRNELKRGIFNLEICKRCRGILPPKNMNPKVSVIIPTYNRPQLIKRAIKSVLNQTYQNFEIIIIDDSPNNETEKVVKELQDNRMKYVRNQVRKGNPGAKNQGVRESSSDSKYIAFLDDDDEYLPLFLEKTIKRLEEEKDIAIATTYAELRDLSGAKIGDNPCECSEFWRVSVGNGCVIRKEVFEKENIWHDEEMKMRYEDLDFGIRLAKTHKWACIPEALRVYYAYPQERGISRSFVFNPETIIKELEYFYQKNQKIYKEAGKRADAWIQFIIGKTLCRAEKIREGRGYLLMALKNYPHPIYLFYYLLALIYPKAFQNPSLIILKHKILKR